VTTLKTVLDVDPGALATFAEAEEPSAVSSAAKAVAESMTRGKQQRSKATRRMCGEGYRRGRDPGEVLAITPTTSVTRAPAASYMK
jgi:hypothetical protein